MITNLNHFLITSIHLIYISNQLIKKAYKLILFKIIYKILQYIDYIILLKYLKNTFGNPNYT